MTEKDTTNTWKKIALNMGVNIGSGIVIAFATPVIQDFILNLANDDANEIAPVMRVRAGLSLHEAYADITFIFILSTIVGIVMCNAMWFKQDRLHGIRFSKCVYCILGCIAGAFAGAVVSMLMENIMALFCVSVGAVVGTIAGWMPLLASERCAFYIFGFIFIGGYVGGVIGSVIGEGLAVSGGLSALIGMNVCALIGGLTGGYLCGKKMYLRSLK